jgi:hypothetical protein
MVRIRSRCPRIFARSRIGAGIAFIARDQTPYRRTGCEEHNRKQHPRPNFSHVQPSNRMGNMPLSITVEPEGIVPVFLPSVCVQVISLDDASCKKFLTCKTGVSPGFRLRRPPPDSFGCFSLIRPLP